MDSLFRKTVFTILTLMLAAALVFSAGMVMAAESALTGDQEVPPVNTFASGNSTIYVSVDGVVTGSVNTSGIVSTAAHIHLGAPGTSGPPIVVLAKTSDNVWSVPPGTRLNDEQLREFNAGNLYINVHSNAYKDGEIRTQMKR